MNWYISQGSPEKQPIGNTYIYIYTHTCVCVCVYRERETEREIYYEEFAHVVMEA